MLKIPRLVLVCGNSMFPTYKDGEYLFSVPTSFNKVREGDVLIFRTPYDPKRVVIKRVAMKSTATRELFFLGDNSSDSYDSRNYGFVPYKYVLGKVTSQRQKGERSSYGE